MPNTYSNSSYWQNLFSKLRFSKFKKLVSRSVFKPTQADIIEF